MNIEIKVKKLKEHAKLPYRSSEFAAGYDLYSCIDNEITINPHETVKIPTGIALELPKQCVGLIYARSGLATKEGLAPANKVGVCDSDYRGEYIVALHNHSNKTAVVKTGERIAQLVIAPFYDATFFDEDNLSETNRGIGGFGSTGK